MNIEELKYNIEMEKEIVRELYSFANQFNELSQETSAEKLGRIIKKQEERVMLQAINSLIGQLRIINNSIPDLLKGVSVYKQLPGENTISQQKKLVSLKYTPAFSRKNMNVTIKEKDMRDFMSELTISKNTIKRIKKYKEGKKEHLVEFKKANKYGRFANKLFSKSSKTLIKEGYFRAAINDLRKSNLSVLSGTYVSMIILSTILAFIAGVFLYVFLIFFKVSLTWPIISVIDTSIERLLWNLCIIIILPILTFLAFYYYPASEAMSLKRKIEQEIPFVAIHMSAIAGSGIEPSQIFKIIALSSEYKYTRQEIRKVLNQINVYGYDLSNALKNSARATSSPKLSELFKGLATTITSGGSLNEFLDKRSESLLLDYKLEREKYSKIAETFMDIYISVVIAAPMIMMLLLVLINISGISIGLSMMGFTLVIILIVFLINIVFLVFLQIKQPAY
ncbi:MAG: type II secretion system F family protein [archaeon]